MIAVIDYDGGNTKSILNVLDRCGLDYVVTYDENKIKSCSKLILPGVSNFSFCIESLKKKKLDKLIKDHTLIKKKPFLGICSGMQILGSFSEEGNVEGLNIIPGKIKKIPVNIAKIVPHVGWNKVHFRDSLITEGLKNNSRFYFCHSYFYEPEDPKHCFMKTHYGIEFCAGVHSQNIFGIQFHPEKSLSEGIKIIENFSRY
jgi:glutamine amidotransferase